MTETYIAIGSNKPQKRDAVEAALRAYGKRYSFRLGLVPVHLRRHADHLNGDHSIRYWAQRRAQRALELSFEDERFGEHGADLGIGLQSGVVRERGRRIPSRDDKEKDRIYTTSWVAIVNRAGYMSYSNSGRVLIPPEEAEEIEAELKEKRRGPHHIVLSALTHGLVTRSDLYQQALQNAIVPFLNPKTYETGLHQ
jgi:non-canonical (house-cleaning) NTP pyrophosphatase